MDVPVLPPPGKLKLAAELPRAAATLAAAVLQHRALRDAPPGDGRPVMVLPGVATGDSSVALLAAYLRRLGYRAETWQLGVNRGVRTVGDDAQRLIDRIEAMARTHDAPVTLVGVSLGGIMARIVAHRAPASVRQVITVCSPYAADARATNAWRTYQLLSGERVDGPAVLARFAEARQPLPMPGVAIWARDDGMVNGDACHVSGEPGLRVFAIDGGHLLVSLRPELWRLIARLLADEPDPDR